MTPVSFKFDEIGYWSELKLEIVEKYGSAYTTTFKNTPLKKYYIDGLCGAGVHFSKKKATHVEGSPSRALKISPPFDRYYFIDIDREKTAYLKKICGTRRDVHIHTGDSSEYLTKELLPKIRFNNYERALCLLDPYGLHIDWEVMYEAGQSKAIDMFLNFPVMDMNRNAIWKNPGRVPRDGIERMTKFWEDESWKQAAYAESPQRSFFEPEMVKQGNDDIVAAFRQRLKKIAGFKFVPQPLPMRNSNSAVVYYLFFASQKPVAEKTIGDIFRKYR